ncbi:MAG: serine/threonine protein kinase, partial [Polyangiaceae bacterium]|nr:serine/threonine protein kinase [Polyangiaceae bacterium]
MSSEEERIGKYRVIEELDRTVHTRILRAHDDEVGRDVVLKYLKPTVPARFERSLLREVEVLGELRCANVVQLYDVIRNDTDSKSVLVLEHIEGPTLAEVLKRRKTIPPAMAIALAAELARILSEVHRAGWVHADVKPSNMILSRSNMLRLLDFNSATKVSAVSQTDTDSFVTHAYVSPEHLLGEPLTDRADVFALGVVLYEWISGQRP